MDSFLLLACFFFISILVFGVDITSLILIMHVIFSLLHLAELNCKIETRRLQISVSSWNLIVSISVVTSHCYMCFVVAPQEGFRNFGAALITVSQLLHFPGTWFSNIQQLHTRFGKWAHMPMNIWKFIFLYCHRHIC